MRKWFFLLAVLCYTFTYAQKPLSVQMAESQHNLQEYWDGASGLIAYALTSVSAQYPEESIAQEWAKIYLDRVLDENGVPIDYQKGVLEQMLPGKALINLYKQTQDEKYKKAFNWLHTYLVMNYPRIKKNTGKTGFLHEDAYPNQMWLQDLYDGCSFYAQWLAACDEKNKAGWTDIAVQFITLDKQAYNKILGLTYPHWSADPGNENSFWANRGGIYSGTSKVFTGQSTGYLLAALTEVLEAMPKNQAGYNQLHDILQHVAEGVQNWQDESGCWYQLIAFNSEKQSSCGISNYLESTASALLTYGLLKGVRTGLLDAAKYGPTAEKAYEGLVKQFVTEEGGVLTLKDASGYIGIGNGAEMGRDGSEDYYLCGEDVEKCDNDPKAVAAFILATLEHEKALK